MNIKTFQKIFDEEYQKFRTQKETDKAFIEKFNTETDKPVPTFEEDPIGYILYSYPTLKEYLEKLLTKDFLDYVTGIYVIAPIPTTFKIILHNNQFFYMIYMGRTWMAKVSGKKYYLLNVGERGRATEAIARLLAMGAPLGLAPSGEASESATTEVPLPSEGSNPFASAEAGTETPPAGEGAPPSEGGGAPLTESKKKVLLEIGKKYPIAFRIALKQILLLEGSINQNSAKVVQRILSSEENKEYGFTPMTKSSRVANPNKIPTEQFLDLLQKLYPEADIKIIPPKTGINQKPFGSSKFPMYSFDTEYGPVGIILASGMNKGEKYEKEFVEKMKANVGKKITDIKDEELVQLYDYLEIDPSALTEKDIIPAGKTDTKRSINFDKPEDIGNKIADIIIKYSGQDYNISLKDPKGDYIYNGGNVKFIKQNKEGGIYFDEEAFIKDNSPIKQIFEVTGINPQRIAEGLENYVKKEGLPSQWETIQDYDGIKLEKMLASSYGYGYYYVRQVKPGELLIKDINSEDDITQLIGEVKSVKVKYPSIASKSCEARVETNSPEGGQNTYQIDIRNSAGGILPSIKVKSIGTKQ